MRRSFTAFLLLSVLCMTGCSVNSGADTADSIAKKHTADIFAMDTYMTLTAYGDGAEAALSAAKDEILRLESIFSVTLEGSEVSAINASAGTPVSVSTDTAETVAAAHRYGELTGGALDVTLYPVLREWGFTTGDYHIPTYDTLEVLLKNVDYKSVQSDGVSVTIGAGQQIDLGALAKGYTGDRMISVLRENGVNSAIVSLGGNVQALGRKPDGSEWTVAVTDPFSPERNMCTLKIADEAVITSGDYERYFIGEDGKRYCHIMDPADGYPADNGLVSVTVIGSSGIMCDALSTALFVMGTDDAVGFYRTMQDKTDAPFDLILVTDDGRMLYTEGIADSFTNESTMNAEVIEK